MADSPYLIAIALVTFAGQRAMPLNGKSQPATASQDSDPGEAGYTLGLELLLRVWQRSEEGALQRAGSDDSLLLLELPLEAMTEQRPLLKANGIAGGDTAALLSALEGLAIRGRRVGIANYEPVRCIP